MDFVQKCTISLKRFFKIDFFYYKNLSKTHFAGNFFAFLVLYDYNEPSD